MLASKVQLRSPNRDRRALELRRSRVIGHSHAMIDQRDRRVEDERQDPLGQRRCGSFANRKASTRPSCSRRCSTQARAVSAFHQDRLAARQAGERRRVPAMSCGSNSSRSSPVSRAMSATKSRAARVGTAVQLLDERSRARRLRQLALAARLRRYDCHRRSCPQLTAASAITIEQIELQEMPRHAPDVGENR